MNRTEMIREIAKQANCSKRLVRKKLFELSARFKKDKRFKNLKFNQAFLNKDTNWVDGEKLHADWVAGIANEYFMVSNRFEVIYFMTGCNVMLYVDHVYDGEPGFVYVDPCGVRLYNY